MKKSISENELRQRLLTHYKLFNEGHLWLDTYGESSGTCVICSFVYSAIPSFKVAKQVAKYVKKQIPHHMFSYIYVGPFHFKPEEL